MAKVKAATVYFGLAVGLLVPTLAYIDTTTPPMPDDIRYMEADYGTPCPRPCLFPGMAEEGPLAEDGE